MDPSNAVLERERASREKPTDASLQVLHAFLIGLSLFS